MCGISGGFAFNAKGSGFLEKVPAANAALVKRGPDGGDVFLSGNVALGHRRLSIIDVSCAGSQPMTTPDGRYTIAFNGEIFNYQQLRQQYLSPEAQQQLRSQSDTEVFLALYAQLKEKAFELLQGFFAAALYDNQTGELVLVRDRYGKKPLLFYLDEEKLLFASEMKALFENGIPKEINWNLLPVYFQLNYIPQPYSLVKNVQKLKPGHFLVVRPGQQVFSRPYYELNLKPQEYGRLTYETAQKKLVDLMDESVQSRMIADVPLGSFLSGGIDSSVVVALAARHTNKLNTFSIGYKDNPYFDETHYAKLVAKKYKTEHTVFSLGNDDFLEHVQSVLDYIDEPFADSSAIPVYILSHHTRKHVTVALSGDGGDEVFAGYNKHAAEWRMRQGGALNTLVKKAAPVLELLPKSRNNKLTNKFRQLHRYAIGARLTPAERYWRWAAFQSRNESLSLLHDRVKQQINTARLDEIRNEFAGPIKGADFNEVLLADMNLVLQGDMLVKVDLMSMANSLEIRSPFLDTSVVEFAFGLPTHFKIDASMKKKLVQDAFRPFLPEEIYNRPKQGFEIPLLGWFRKELWPLIDNDLLSDAFVEQQGIFSLEATRSLKKQLLSNNPGDSHAIIWALIVFQNWWKRYMAS
ncbi:asparagine synthase (glutamine-hydrolyzing) [Paraflavisolibacter sp. H34]|uniref:asparagine synthase (glutamine-hydrolyzing) n=1 Tax=Huijunlia imazamoxiresistens TaxID=3127457 RepID=UPI0030194308